MAGNWGDAIELEGDPAGNGGQVVVFNYPVRFNFPVSGGAGSGQNFADGETPAGTIDGVNASFTLAHTPVPATSLKVFSDGIRVKPSEYTITGTALVFNAGSPFIPQTELVVDYRW